jgi:glutathione S-transferase
VRKLYYDPASTVSRPISIFLAEHDLDVELVTVRLAAGEHRADWFAAVNPNRAVPVLEEDGFVLTESAAILRYLAELADSPDYPKGLRERAKVEEALDWFNTGFYRDHGYGLVYPQILPHYQVHEAQRTALLAWHRGRAEARLQVLNDHMIGDLGVWAAGESFSIADMFGASLVTIGEMVGFSLAPWPNVRRWLAAVQARPSWERANAAFYAWQEAIRAPARAAA